MSGIQEIAEALNNLSVKEVNELSFVLNSGGMEQVATKPILRNDLLTPREFGIKKLNRRK